MIAFLTSEQIVAIHDAVLSRHGGGSGAGHRGGLEVIEAVAQAVKNSYYEGAEELAAAYAVYIVQGHVFLDGNKRTALAAMDVFLAANGVKSRASNQDMFEAMLEIQTRIESGERTGDVIRWLAGKV